MSEIYERDFPLFREIWSNHKNRRISDYRVKFVT